MSGPGLWVALALGLAGASAAWLATGRPRPMSSPRSLVTALRPALAGGPVAALAVAVGLGLGYSLVVGVAIAANDGDALAYHLPRALLWRQQEAVGWIADATDPRLNVMPPVAEMGQVATMLVTDRDRFVAMGALAALIATIGAVARLARQLGYDIRAALFGALLFATLPVVILQAASALNDLVVCSFLGCAATLLISERRSAVIAGSVSTALAVGAKVTAVLGLPWIVLLVVVSMRRGRLASLIGLGAGVLLGSVWYWVNIWQTGALDGDYGADSGQRPTGLGAVATTIRQLALDLLDRSGVNGGDVAVYVIAAVALAAVSVVVGLRGGRWQGLLLGAVLLAVVPPALAPVGRLLLRAWQEAWTALGDRELAYQPPTEFELPVLADATESWYGPVLVVCLALAPIAVLRRSGPPRRRFLLVALSAAPIVSIVGLAAVLTYDPYRGRFLMFAVALAAVSWGSLLRWPGLAWGLTGLAVVSGAMSLAMSMGKPSGLVLFEEDPGLVSRASIWRRSRPDQQGQLRPGAGEAEVMQFVEDVVDDGATIALAFRANDFLSPFFGAKLGRHVVLVPGLADDRVSRAEWLVTAPRTRTDQCPDDWRERFGVGDWKVLQRVGRGGCA
jgi:hypothetical protein